MNFETSLEQGLTYLDTVDSARQRYFVFEATDTFMVFSLSSTKPNSGNFNLVNRKAVDYVHRKFRGQEDVTSNDVVEQSKRTRHAPTTLQALNVLYVLVAQKRACLDDIGSHSRLYFSVLNGDVRSPVRKQTVKKKVAKKKAVRKVAKKKATRKVAKNRAVWKVAKRVAKKEVARKAKKKAVIKKKARNGQQARFHGGYRYKLYIVETFLPQGEPSSSGIRVRPVAGQRLSKNSRVKCGKPFRSRYPVGTKFRMWARISDRKGGTPFLYSPYVWEPKVL